MTTSLEVPGPGHRLLLQAALCRSQAATEAWVAWKEDSDLDQLDPSSQWLLPLLYCNLKAHSVPEEDLLPYRSVYRHNWYKNILSLNRLKKLLTHLRQQELTCVVYGAAALTLAQYGDLGARPIHVLNLLYQEHQAEVLEAIVAGQGWLSTGRRGHFVDAAGRILKGKHALETPSIDGSSTFAAFAGEPIPTLDRQAHLHLILSRNTRWDEKSSLFWMADSAAIMRTLNQQEVDSFRVEYGPQVALIEAIMCRC